RRRPKLRVKRPRTSRLDLLNPPSPPTHQNPLTHQNPRSPRNRLSPLSLQRRLSPMSPPLPPRKRTPRSRIASEVSRLAVAGRAATPRPRPDKIRTGPSCVPGPTGTGEYPRKEHLHPHITPESPPVRSTPVQPSPLHSPTDHPPGPWDRAGDSA